MGLSAIFAFAVNAQTTVRLKNPLKRSMVKNEGNTNARIGGPVTVLQVGANITCNTQYVAGSTMDLDMTYIATNTDFEYVDFLELTFPAGITPTGLANTSNPFPNTEDFGGGLEVLNAPVGQVISWGANTNDLYGGIFSTTGINFIVNVTIAPGTTGNQTVNYLASGDGYGGATSGNFNGTFVILDGAVPSVNMKTIFVQPYNLTSLSNCNYGLDTLVAQITNIGTTTESNINVFYNVNGGTAMMTVVSGPLAPGDSTFVFWLPGYDFSATNNYDIKAWVAQPSDINLVNDTTSLSFSNNVSTQLTSTNYVNGIEAAQVADISVQGTAAGFTGLSTSTIHSGAQALFTTVNTTTVTANQGVYNVFVTLPCMDVVAGETYRISYWRKVNNNPATHRGSGGIFTGLSNNGPTMSALKPFSPVTPTGPGAINWSKDSVDYVAVANETRYFAVAGQGTVNATTSFNFRIDDIKIARVCAKIMVNSGAICAGNSFTMVPSGATTYTYSNGSDVVTPSANTSYTITGDDATYLCAISAVSSVSVNALPTISVNSGSICVGNSFIMTPSGATTYTYSNGSNVATPSVDQSYTVTGTDANGCENTAVSSVSVNALPAISVNSGVVCAGQSFTMVPSGATTYTYSSGSDVVTPTAASESYTVTGADANGCENTAVSSVSVNTLPTISATSNNTLLCTGETATLTASGATTYIWNTSDITESIAVTPTVQTTYTVIGTDANGCSNLNTVTQDVNICTGIKTISANNAISIFPNPTSGILNVNTIEVNTSIEVINVIGEKVYSNTLVKGNNSIDLSGLSNGAYFVKLNSNNQIITKKVVISK